MVSIASMSTVGRLCRWRPTASSNAMRVSHVESRASARNSDRWGEAEVGLLDDVLGFGVVLEDGAGDPVELLIVSFHDQPEGSPITLSRAFNERSIVEILEPAGLGCLSGILSRGASFRARVQI